LVEFGSDAPDALLLIELLTPVTYAKATILPGDVLDEYGFGIVPKPKAEEGEESKPEPHPGGRNIAHRNTAVRFLSSYSVKEDELRRMLGWEVKDR
jgi:hypothetical protein